MRARYQGRFFTMNKRQTPLILVKLAIAASILYWIFHKVDAGRVWGTVRGASVGPVLLGVLLCWLTILIAGWRWHRLLAIFEIQVSLPQLVLIAQIGQFFLMFLPGPAGDDLTRMLYISRFAKGRVGEACSSVLLDRCIGLASILLFSVACIPVQWNLLAAHPQTRWMATAMLLGGVSLALFGTVFLALPAGVSVRFLELFIGWLPEGNLRRELGRMSCLICTNKKSILLVVLVAIGTQLMLCTVYLLAGRAVGIHVSPLVWFSFLPVVLAANAVPVTIAGVGVREYLLVLFLGSLADVPGELALAASLIAFGMMLAICLLGGLVYVVYRPGIGK